MELESGPSGVRRHGEDRSRRVSPVDRTDITQADEGLLGNSPAGMELLGKQRSVTWACRNTGCGDAVANQYCSAF
jgi:hypothetical protein